jgi:phage FluMu protein Com
VVWIVCLVYLTMQYIARVEKHNVIVECGICGEPLKRSREVHFMRYRCPRCQILYYVCFSTEPPDLIRTRQKPERLSLFVLSFPFAVIAILELLYHLFI